MNLLFSQPRNKLRKEEPAAHPLVVISEQPHNITDGSEFLDDAIRTHEQPLMHTEENIGVGCPEDLL